MIQQDWEGWPEKYGAAESWLKRKEEERFQAFEDSRSLREHEANFLARRANVIAYIAIAITTISPIIVETIRYLLK